MGLPGRTPRCLCKGQLVSGVVGCCLITWFIWSVALGTTFFGVNTCVHVSCAGEQRPVHFSLTRTSPLAQIGEHPKWDTVPVGRTRFPAGSPGSFDPRLNADFSLLYLRHAGPTAGAGPSSQMKMLHAALAGNASAKLDFLRAQRLLDRMHPDFACPAGLPVLFVHGHRGTGEQASSFAVQGVSQALQDGAAPGHTPLSWFALDFHEAPTAFHAGLMQAQAAFVNDAIARIQAWYAHPGCAHSTAKIAGSPASAGWKPPVLLLAHSMGGIVARLAFISPNHIPGSVTNLVTLNSPHQAHPVDADATVAALYQHINAAWHTASTGGPDPHMLRELTVVSFTGGFGDALIRPDLTRLDGLVAPSHAVWAPLDSVPGVWGVTSHDNIVACGPFLVRFLRTLRRVAHAMTAPDSPPPSTTWRRHLLLQHADESAPHPTHPAAHVPSTPFTIQLLPAWLVSRIRIGDGLFLLGESAANRVFALTEKGVDVSDLLSLGVEGSERKVELQGHVPDPPSAGAPASTPKVCLHSLTHTGADPSTTRLTLTSNAPPLCVISGLQPCAGPPGGMQVTVGGQPVTWLDTGPIPDGHLRLARHRPVSLGAAAELTRAVLGKGEPPALSTFGVPQAALQGGGQSPHTRAALLPVANSAWEAHGTVTSAANANGEVCLTWTRPASPSAWQWLTLSVSQGPPPAPQRTTQVAGGWAQALGLAVNPLAWVAAVAGGGVAALTQHQWVLPHGATPTTLLLPRGSRLSPVLLYTVTVRSVHCGVTLSPGSASGSDGPAFWGSLRFAPDTQAQQVVWSNLPLAAHSAEGVTEALDAQQQAQLDSTSQVLRWLVAAALRWDLTHTSPPALHMQEVLAQPEATLAPHDAHYTLKVGAWLNDTAAPGLSLTSDPRCHRTVTLSPAPSSLLLAWVPHRLHWVLTTLCTVVCMHLFMAHWLWVVRRQQWKRGKRLWKARLWEFQCQRELGWADARQELPTPELPHYPSYPSLAHIQRRYWLVMMGAAVVLSTLGTLCQPLFLPKPAWQQARWLHGSHGTPVAWEEPGVLERLLMHALGMVIVAAYCALLSGIATGLSGLARVARACQTRCSECVAKALSRGHLPAPCARFTLTLLSSCAWGAQHPTHTTRKTSGGNDDELGIPMGGIPLGLPPLREAPPTGITSLWNVVVATAKAGMEAAEPDASYDDPQADAATTPTSVGRFTPHVAQHHSEADDDVMLGVAPAQRDAMRAAMQSRPATPWETGQPSTAPGAGLHLGAELSLGLGSRTESPPPSGLGADSPPLPALDTSQNHFLVSLPAFPPPAGTPASLASPTGGTGVPTIRVALHQPPGWPVPSQTHDSSGSGGPLHNVPHRRSLSSTGIVMDRATPPSEHPSLGGVKVRSAGGVPLATGRLPDLSLTTPTHIARSKSQNGNALQLLTLGVPLPQAAPPTPRLRKAPSRPPRCGSMESLMPSQSGGGGGGVHLSSGGRSRLSSGSASDAASDRASSPSRAAGAKRRGRSSGAASGGEFACIVDDVLEATGLADQADGRVQGDMHVLGEGSDTPPDELPQPTSVAAAAAMTFHARVAAAAAHTSSHSGLVSQMGHRVLGSASAPPSSPSSPTQASDAPSSLLLLSMPDTLADAVIAAELDIAWRQQDAACLATVGRDVSSVARDPLGAIAAWMGVPDEEQDDSVHSSAAAPALIGDSPIEQERGGGARWRGGGWAAASPPSSPTPTPHPAADRHPASPCRGRGVRLATACACLPARLWRTLQRVDKHGAAMGLVVALLGATWMTLVTVALVLPWLVAAGAFVGLLLQALWAAATLPPSSHSLAAAHARATVRRADSSTAKLGRRSRGNSMAEADAALRHFTQGQAVAAVSAVNETRHQEAAILLYTLLFLTKITTVLYTAEAASHLRHPFHRDIVLALPLALHLFSMRVGKPQSNSAVLPAYAALLLGVGVAAQGRMYAIPHVVAAYALLNLAATLHHALARTPVGQLGTALFRRASAGALALPVRGLKWLRGSGEPSASPVALVQQAAGAATSFLQDLYTPQLPPHLQRLAAGAPHL